MFTRFFIFALGFSVIQITLCIPTTNSRSIGSEKDMDVESALFRRGDLSDSKSASIQQLGRRTTKGGCHSGRYSRRALHTRHREEDSSSGSHDSDDEDDDGKEEEHSEAESHSHACSHSESHASSKTESGLPGMSMLSGSGSPLKMLGGAGGGDGGGGLPGNPMKMLGGGGGGLPIDLPMKGLPGLR